MKDHLSIIIDAMGLRLFGKFGAGSAPVSELSERERSIACQPGWNCRLDGERRIWYVQEGDCIACAFRRCEHCGEALEDYTKDLCRRCETYLDQWVRSRDP